jgi:hypothetical protein
VKMGKVRELSEEFRTVVVGRSNITDSIVPPLVFVVINALSGLQYAIAGSLAFALLIALIRLSRHQPVRYALGGVGAVALGGVGAVALAAVVAQLLGRAEGYFLPAIVAGGGTLVVCLLSVLVRRPLVAWTSHLARGWPLAWYWHPRVRPAYSEVTWLWALFFAIRLLFQLALFQGAVSELLAVVNVALGWPATIVLLVVSYLYGTWRLRNLSGPSVEEFKRGAEPPWTGQQRGF